MKDYSYSMMILANIGFLANRKRHEEEVRRKGLLTVGCYEVLAQPKYKRKLQYVPVALRKEGADVYQSSEKLRRVVDYAYFRDD